MQTEIMNQVIDSYTQGNAVKLHVTKIDYEPTYKYNTTCGLYVNGELTETFELTDISNDEIDEFMAKVQTEINKNTLYLI